jgi:hypothetical protein
LPLPRNLVLISLLETASKRHATLLGGKINLMDTYSDTDNSITNEEDAVLDSIDALSSPCGTYIVKERYGLPVYTGNSTNPETMDDTNQAKTKATKPTKILSYGQKIQVVDIQDGMYQLARDEGLVFANSTQLVKGKTVTNVFSMHFFCVYIDFNFSDDILTVSGSCKR